MVLRTHTCTHSSNPMRDGDIANASAPIVISLCGIKTVFQHFSDFSGNL